MDTDDGASRPFGMIPDILLDEDRLNMLLDIVCADYITACYASHENGKRVVLQALEKLYLSVHANGSVSRSSTGGAAPATASHAVHRVGARPAQDALFQERARRFYQDLVLALGARQQQADDAALEPATGSVVTSSLARGLDESLVREVMKPRLLQIVEEMCRERDRQLVLTSEGATFSGHSGAAGSSAAAMAGETGVADETDVAAVAAALLPTASSEIRMEGWLRKKGQHVNLWRERYFMIRSTLHGTHFLCYLRKKGDKEPRGWYVLGPGTTVDEVRESPSKIETKRLFTFRIRHLNYAKNDEVSEECGGGVESTPRTTPSRPGNEFQSSLMDPTIGSHDAEFDARASVRRATSRKLRHRAAAAAAAATAATAVVLTGGLAGVGIGMMGMSMSAAAAASAGAAGAMIAQSRSKGPIALAAESLETAVWWRNSILECIAQAEEQWKRYLNWYMDHETDMDEACSTFLPENRQQGSTAPTSGVRRRRSMSLQSHGKAAPPARNSESSQQPGLLAPRMGTRQRSGSFGSMPRSIAKTFRTSATFSQETSWQLYEFSDKLRVDTERSSHQSSLRTSAPPPAFRTSLKVNASPRKVFEMLMKMDSPFYSSNHVIEDARILEEHTEDHSDVIYWKLFSTYLWPVSVSARELCLLRYWRMEPDGSYFICYQSTTHADCPHSTGAVRANILGGGFIISPRVQEDSDNHFDECWVTLAIQMNPNGWIDWTLARSWYYVHAYGVFFLEMITAVTAAEGRGTVRPVTAASDRHRANDGSESSAPSQQIVVETKFSMLERYRTDLTVLHGLPTRFWSEPSAAGFMVRGPQYMTSRMKVPSAPQICRLVNVELFKSSEAIEHVGVSSFVGDGSGDLDTANPAAEDRPFIFIINFMLPGPPHHSLVLYFAVTDPSELDKDPVFADLCHDIFRGPDDELRSQRIKLIPRVVQGTWSIREGVGTTPAILGTKVYQNYYQGKHYLEVDYDIGSSIVATGILNMLLGYSCDLIIDLAFVIEAQSVSELPERVLGTEEMSKNRRK
ncbi:unnamed protein product [Hyaloperonospora brassicae]|uniref:START domain-containing protein n=1 Tax=Hyaloperonospora brassicae TaxID=162125 RepID=A0AAV0T6C9_HYABA|nr:unnamed protein product [Hyaloperonospora brassicae]